MNGTVPLPAPPPPILEPVGATPAGADVVPVGEGVERGTEVVATTLGCVAVDDGEASGVLVAGEDAAVVEAGAAVATQSQTALPAA